MYGSNKTLSKFYDEEIIEDHHSSPSFQYLTRHQSPRSSWSLSPSLNPSNPSLLYCCISSLRHHGDILSITVVNGDLVLTGSSSRSIHAWQSVDCHAKGYIQASSGEVRAMLAYDDMLFTSHKDHKIRVWNMRNFSGKFRATKVITLPSANHFKGLVCTSISPPHHKSTSKPIDPQHKDIISCMAFYYVEGILYTGSFDRSIKTWKLSSKKCIDSFIAHGDHIHDMVVNQQNGYLFTCSSDGTIKMWLRVSGESCHVLIKVFSFQTCPVYALALGTSPSQRSFLYSGSSDGCINFWVQEISTHYNNGGILEGHQFAVLCLKILENLVISGSEDSTIRIWRRDRIRFTHECLAILEGHRGPVRCLDATLQDEIMTSFLVYSGSLDQTFKVWRVKLIKEVMKKSPCRGSIGNDDNEDASIARGEGSPVLSPSWVKKKIQWPSIH